MFIPIGDTPNPKNYIAWVNWMLIAANVGIYVFITLPMSIQPIDPQDPLLAEYIQLFADRLQGMGDVRRLIGSLTAYDLFVFAHGYKPGDPQLTALFTSMFLHGGAAHLGGNMLFLWIFGNNVEHHLGRGMYLIVYLLTGVAATLTFSLFAGQSMTPLVGASGAISGVLGLYFLLFKRNRVKVFIFLFPFINVFLIPVRYVLAFYVLIDNLLPFVLSAESSVAYGAHLGGFFAGLGVAWAGERLAWRWPAADRTLHKKQADAFVRTTPPKGDILQEVTTAIEAGDQPRAVDALLKLDRNQMAAITPDQCVVLADWLLEHNMITTANRLLRRCIVANPGSNDLARVFLTLGLLSLKRGQPTAAYQHLLAVFDYNPDPETEAKTRAALSEINIYERRRRH
ncbi:MAG: rhomboid family intramembrane serine protease [Myxococcota bacterium]|nr:rhomboid family intramembrane serine protease [Myxococcota bacterium]